MDDEATKITYSRTEAGDWIETRTCPGGGAGMGGSINHGSNFNPFGGLGGNNPSGATANFGNPDARGGTANGAGGFTLPSGAIEPVLAPWEIAGAARALQAAPRVAARAAVPLLRAALTTPAAYRLFGSQSILNHNRYLRVGFGRFGGDQVFRISGQWLQSPWAQRLGVERGHIDIINLGPLTGRPR